MGKPMKQRLSRWRPAIPALVTAVLLCALALPALLLYTRPMDNRVYALIDFEAPPGEEGTENWSFYLNRAGELTPLTPNGVGGYDGLAYDGQTFYYSCILNQELDSPTLRIDAVNRSVAVFLDGVLLYTDCPELNNQIGYLELPMQEWDRMEPIQISLPPGYQGGTLTIAQSTSTGGGELQGYSTVFPCGVTLYCGFAYESSLISSATGTAMRMAFLFFLAVALLLLLIYQACQHCADWGILFLAALLLVRLVGVMASSDFRLQYLPWMTTPDFTTMSLLLSAAAAACFLAVHMDRLPRICLCAGAALQTILVLAECWCQTQNIFIVIWLPTTISTLLLMAALVLCGIHWYKGDIFFTQFCRTALSLAAIFTVVSAIFLLVQPEYWSHLVLILQSIAPWNTVFLLRLLILLTAAASVVALALKFLRSQAEQSARQTALAMRAQMAQDSYRSIRLQAEEVAMMRHDLQKHLAVVSTLLADHQPGKAMDYLAQVSQSLSSIRPVVDTGNYLIDILLNSKLGQLRNQGVRLEVRAVSAPVSLPVSDVDLSALLLNALDNAAHAVTEDAVSDPCVALTLYTKGEYFYFACENTMCPEESRHDKKAAEPEHGYGILIMHKIVEKYDGIMETSQSNDRFRLVLVLPLGKTDPPAPKKPQQEGAVF